jgi:hypothetical protein
MPSPTVRSPYASINTTFESLTYLSFRWTLPFLRGYGPQTVALGILLLLVGRSLISSIFSI